MTVCTLLEADAFPEALMTPKNIVSGLLIFISIHYYFLKLWYNKLTYVLSKFSNMQEVKVHSI